jgi:DNA polymerase III epsilon subunit-like protein
VLVVDLETTGLGPEAEIVDITALAMDGRVVLNSLICPLKTIPAEATKVHGITERMVHKAPLFREFYPRIVQAFRDKTLCIYNGEYDTGIIRQVCRAEKLPDPVGSWQCALLAYADFAGVPGKRPGEFRWHKLADACKAMGVDLVGAHRARADAEATRRLVLAMAGNAKPAESVQLDIFGNMAPETGPVRDWTR